MDCSTDALMRSANCFRCIPAGSTPSVLTYLMCQWANKPTGLPIIPDMLTWWKMEEGAGNTVFDSMSSGINGTFNNNPTWVAGKVGTWAVRFPVGTNANIRNTTAFDFTNQAFSFNIWVLVNTLAADAVPIYKGFLSQAGYFSRLMTTGAVQFTTIQGAASQVTQTVGGLFAADGTWHMYSYVRNGASVKLYVDGVEPAYAFIGVHVNPLTSNEPFCLGIYNIITSNPLVGRVDDFMVFSRAITPAEITILWNGGAGYP